MKIKLICLVALSLAQWTYGANNAPEQVHIALGSKWFNQKGFLTANHDDH